MKIYSLHEEQFLPVTISKAWDFFSSAENLPVITPPALNFKIVSDVKGKEIYDGMLIKYKVSPLFKIPLSWKSEIASVNKPYSFTDRQIKGPYQLWQHTHDFVEKNDGVLMKDTVQYGLPFGVLGELMHFFIVRKKLKDIFNYRKQILNQIFTRHANNIN
ncbi:MAG TPA: SRPBCC family protein [Hanamia sp.]|nr:SRPBCC family protein [Hanamia sp.]